MGVMKFKSNGKLMITGEYLALDNALVLTLPTKFGQSLELTTNDGTGLLYWKSLTNEKEIWFEATFQFKNNSIGIIKSSNEKIGSTLLKILQKALELSSSPIKENYDYVINTLLEFPQNWGLGSSSTLMNNIAEWFKIDPFELHFSVFNGSGYDVAAAYSSNAITYQLNNKKPKVENVSFDPSFKDHIFFIHLNKKQNSFNAVKNYQTNKDKVTIVKSVEKINQLTTAILKSKSLTIFEELLDKHEMILSSILKTPTIKAQLFPDYYGGVIKSLGAWGGDFILVTGNNQSINYFKKKGYNTILSYNEMIL